MKSWQVHKSRATFRMIMRPPDPPSTRQSFVPAGPAQREPFCTVLLHELNEDVTASTEQFSRPNRRLDSLLRQKLATWMATRRGAIPGTTQNGPKVEPGLIGVNAQLLFRSRQAPISMRICAGLASAKLTFFSRLSPASGATNFHGQFLFRFHGSIMHGCPSPG